MVYAISQEGGRLNTQKMVLAGVILSFLLSAVTLLILTVGPAENTQPILFWLMGKMFISY